MKEYSKIYSLLLLVLLSLYGCEKEDSLSGVDDRITEFKLTLPGDVTYQGVITSDNVVRIQVPIETDLSGAKVYYAISPGATIRPLPERVSDWNVEQVFSVTSKSGKRRTYIVRIQREKQVADEDIYLKTNEDVEAFVHRNVSNIRGNLIIGQLAGQDSIDNLDALTYLEKVDYKIVINPTYRGSDLAGLRNLKEVGSLIVDNDKLQNTLQLKSLAKVHEEITIRGERINHLLLPSLVSVDGKVYLDAPNLSTINLSRLEHAGSIEFLPSSLSSIKLSNLTTVETDFKIDGLSKLALLSVPKLKSIGRKLILKGTDQLAVLTLPLLEQVNEGITIENVGLGEIYFLKLKHTKSLTINNAGTLSILQAPELREIASDFSLINSNIKSLEDIYLERAGGEIILKTVTAMEDIASFVKRLREVPSIMFDYMLSSQPLDFSGCKVGVLKLVKCSNVPEVILPESLDEFAFTDDRYIVRQAGAPVIRGGQRVSKSFKIESVKIDSSESEALVLSDVQEVGKLEISRLDGFGTIRLPKLRTASEFYFHESFLSHEASLKSIELDKLTEVGILNVKAENLTSFSAPELAKAEKLVFSGSKNAHPGCGLTDLNGLSGLKEFGQLSLNNMYQLIDFTFFKPLITGGYLSEQKWDADVKIKGSRWDGPLPYVPTYNDLREGRYVKP